MKLHLTHCIHESRCIAMFSSYYPLIENVSWIKLFSTYPYSCPMKRFTRKLLLFWLVLVTPLQVYLWFIVFGREDIRKKTLRPTQKTSSECRGQAEGQNLEQQEKKQGGGSQMIVWLKFLVLQYCLSTQGSHCDQSSDRRNHAPLTGNDSCPRIPQPSTLPLSRSFCTCWWFFVLDHLPGHRCHLLKSCLL